MNSIFCTGYRSCVAGGVGALIATGMGINPWGGAAVAATSVLVDRITAPLFHRLNQWHKAPDGSSYSSFSVAGLRIGQAVGFSYIWAHLLGAISLPHVFLIGSLSSTLSNPLAG